MTGIAQGEAEHQPRGQDIDGIDEQRRPVLLGVYPFNDLIYRLIVERKRQDISMQMKDHLENDHEETDDDQHLHRRERHQAATADVVAHQIARTPQQLNERIGQRAGVQNLAGRFC